ncbi:MAG: hypothetical protein CL868_02060 [Cytophagaceae bacterium]|nr:hypothetical protein [Flavobacteriaceae bacterium]MAZ25847.1 hypothetical protein [Cytophagaceae bacterium]|tara:strand:- start:780 stop:1424 length:645 start_codon:yes stop_codon:yes gene_type:complete
MKTLIKAYILPVLLVMAFSTASAQNRRSTTNGTTRTESNISRTTNGNSSRTENNTNRTAVNTNNGRVSSSKVTYKTDKKKVVSVRNVSNKTEVKHNGQSYYYDNDKYYTHSGGRYIVIAPKVGFRVKKLPTDYRRISYGNYNYYNANGIFYIHINNEYEVVDPEVGTIVSELPNDYEKVVIDGFTYYEYANILYEKIQINGTRAYEVVGIIEMN